MKKLIVLIVILGLLLVPTLSPAQIGWVTANQATVQWDAVTADVDGDPIPAGTHVEYEVWLVNKVTDPGKTNPAKVATTTATEFTITLGVKGQYLVGVLAAHVEDGTNEKLAESTIAWSDIPDDCQDMNGDGTGDPFGIRFFAALQKTKVGPKPAP